MFLAVEDFGKNLCLSADQLPECSWPYAWRAGGLPYLSFSGDDNDLLVLTLLACPLPLWHSESWNTAEDIVRSCPWLVLVLPQWSIPVCSLWSNDIDIYSYHAHLLSSLSSVLGTNLFSIVPILLNWFLNIIWFLISALMTRKFRTRVILKAPLCFRVVSPPASVTLPSGWDTTVFSWMQTKQRWSGVIQPDVSIRFHQLRL